MNVTFVVDLIRSRASKMVELGADVDELMKECDLPKVELLLSLQKSMPQHYRR